jgi:hypothetical protein
VKEIKRERERKQGCKEGERDIRKERRDEGRE